MTLLDVVPILPKPIQKTIEQITTALITDTIHQKKNVPDHMKPDPPVVPDPPDADDIKKKDIVKPPVIDDNGEWNIDDLFPEQTDIKIVEPKNKSIVALIETIYNLDKLGLKQEYAAAMWMAIQKYAQKMFIVSNETQVPDFSVFLDTFDKDAVLTPNKDLKHLHDTIARIENLIVEESRLLQKTHSSDDTLGMLRYLEAAYQNRKKYYGEQYRKEDTFIGTESNRLLVSNKRVYDGAYEKAVENGYRYLYGAGKISDKVMTQTANAAAAKGELLNAGVDIFAKTPEPPVQVIQNSAYVVPSITAESDFQGRYETPAGNITGGYSSGGGISPSGGIAHDESDLSIMANVIAAEAGGQSYKFKLYVGSVVLNRVRDPDFPNSIREVVLDPSQYEGAGSDLWWSGSGRMTDECVNAAKEILDKGSILPAGVVYQSGYADLGSSMYEELEGNYFMYK